jgi:hypothetical protein
VLGPCQVRERLGANALQAAGERVLPDHQPQSAPPTNPAPEPSTLGAVIAVMALVVGAVSPAVGSSSQGSASTSSGHADTQQTIRVIAVFTEFDANIDVGAPGFSLGDEVVFSGNLLRNGEQVGRVGVVCTFVSTANADRVEAQCPTTSILPGGQITTQGTIVNRSLNFTLPITGGSGRYQGAGGQVVSRDISTPTQPQVELTFQLEF